MLIIYDKMFILAEVSEDCENFVCVKCRKMDYELFCHWSERLVSCFWPAIGIRA
jgi:hypothetical protein